MVETILDLLYPSAKKAGGVNAKQRIILCENEGEKKNNDRYVLAEEFKCKYYGSKNIWLLCAVRENGTHLAKSFN
jgi:hypothetical protein